MHVEVDYRTVHDRQHYERSKRFGAERSMRNVGSLSIQCLPSRAYIVEYAIPFCHPILDALSPIERVHTVVLLKSLVGRL